MRNLKKDIRDINNIEHSLWCAATVGDLPLVKYIVENFKIDLSHKYECIHSRVYLKKEIKKCLFQIIKTELEKDNNDYHDDRLYEDDPYDLWEGESTMRRNDDYKQLQKLEEVYYYLREKTMKDHPELVV